MTCFEETMCNATTLNLVTEEKLEEIYNASMSIDEDVDSGMNLTAESLSDNETALLLTPAPSPTNATLAPTIDLNPANYYCSDSWRTAEYDGDCGPPCPSGLNSECPGEYVVGY